MMQSREGHEGTMEITMVFFGRLRPFEDLFIQIDNQPR